MFLFGNWASNFMICLASIQVLATYPSDQTLFTQGLEMNETNDLILATGQFGDSHIGIMDLETGKFDKKSSLDEEFFGEGITHTPYGIWQLTWKNQVALLRDPQTYQVIKEVPFDTEGWGIAYDKDTDSLWMSDGSDAIYQRDAKTFDFIDVMRVKDKEGQPVKQINELEFANGHIYANLWYTHHIVKISPRTGQVVKQYDLTEILEQLKISESERAVMDVLNGIAHISGDKFYITGKYYPVILEIELQ